MGDGVLIKYTELKAVGDNLKKIVEELKEASSRADVLEGAIGDPYGKNKLREAAEEFEDGWDDRRKKLLEDIEKVERASSKASSNGTPTPPMRWNLRLNEHRAPQILNKENTHGPFP